MTDLDRLALPLAEASLDLPPGPVLFLNAASGPGLAALGPERLCAVQANRVLHDGLVQAGVRIGDGPAGAALVLLTRNRVETLGLIARALLAVPPGGLVLVSGAKSDGVDAILKRLRDLMPVAGSMAKAHGKVFWLSRPDPLPPEIEGWLAEAAPRRNAEGFLTAPGMFSHAHADPGSAFLAATLGTEVRGRVADLGAGYGWLSARLLAQCPKITALALFEADRTALDAARENLGADPRLAFHWADVAGLGKRHGPFDHVVANPPFHAGRAADPGLGQAFLLAASRILTASGRLTLVANRQLPYETRLGELFTEWQELAVMPGYKVLTAFRPKSAPRPAARPAPRPARR